MEFSLLHGLILQQEVVMKLFLALFFMFLKMAHRANRVLKPHIEKERPKVDPRLPLEFISWRCASFHDTI